MEWKPTNRVRNVRRFDTSMVSTCGMERCCKKKNQGGYGDVRDGDGADGAEGAATSESKRTGFGEKKITFWGSFALILNNAMGPGMLVLPLIMQEAGLITSMIVLVAVYLLSTVSCTMLCDAIQRIPGNRDFTQRVEYSTAVDYYLGKRWNVVGQVLFNVSNQTANLIAMYVEEGGRGRAGRLGQRTWGEREGGRGGGGCMGYSNVKRVWPW